MLSSKSSEGCAMFSEQERAAHRHLPSENTSCHGVEDGSPSSAFSRNNVEALQQSAENINKSVVDMGAACLRREERRRHSMRNTTAV